MYHINFYLTLFFFSFLLFYQFWSLIPPKSYFICNSMRVNQITVFQITLENIVCLQNTCLVFVCILTSQLHVVSDKTAINFFFCHTQCLRKRWLWYWDLTKHLTNADSSDYGDKYGLHSWLWHLSFPTESYVDAMNFFAPLGTQLLGLNYCVSTLAMCCYLYSNS